VRIAIRAANESEARAVLGDALAALGKELPLRAAPVIGRRRQGTDDDIWIAVLEPDLTHLRVIDPDNAPTRCSLMMNYFPVDTQWMVPQNIEREAKREWPPEIWATEPGNDVLLHPAVRAVMIFCKDRKK
jgi:hypothetical protein